MKCQVQKCTKKAILQFDHNGEIVIYCQYCFAWFCHIMDSMESFRPTAYKIGSEIK